MMDQGLLEDMGNHHLHKIMIQAKAGVVVTQSVHKFFSTYVKEQHKLSIMLTKMSMEEEKSLNDMPYPDKVCARATQRSYQQQG